MCGEKQFIRNNILVLLTNFFVYFSGLLLVPFIIKSSGAGTYGEYVLLISLLGVSFGISSLGVGFKCHRFLPSKFHSKDRSDIYFPQFTFNLISIALISLAFVLFYSWFSDLLPEGVSSHLLYIVPAYLLFYFLHSQLSDYFRYTHRIKIFNYAIVLQPYIFIGVSLFWFTVSDSLSIGLLLASSAISFAVAAIPMLYKLVQEIGFRLRMPRLKELVSDIKLGLPLVLNYLVESIIISADRYIIAFFMGAASVGHYSAAYVLGALILIIARVFGVVLPPYISNLVDNNEQLKAKDTVEKVVKVYMFFAIPFLFGCLSLESFFLTLYANQTVASESYLVAPIIALGSIFYGLSLIFSNVFFVSQRTKVMFVINVYVAIVNVLLNIAVFMIYENIIVAAITTVVCYFIAFQYVYQKLDDTWKVEIDIKFTVKVIVASIAMSATLFWCKALVDNSIASFLLLTSLGVAIYFLLAKALKFFSQDEKNFIKSSVFSRV